MKRHLHSSSPGRIGRSAWPVLILGWVFGMGLPRPARAQIEKLIVEKYYVSDTNDSTDMLGSSVLQPGTVTYRVYLDLAADSRLVEIYGDADHTLRIESTSPFYNNTDRPNSHFPYEYSAGWFKNNATLALDSWLTLGWCTKPVTPAVGIAAKPLAGVPKDLDTENTGWQGDTSNWLFPNNGGTAGITGGLLVNDDASAGLPLTDKDGYMGYLDTVAIGGVWSSYGFVDDPNTGGTNRDTTVFGPDSIGTAFVSNDAYLRQAEGVAGPTSDNIVLVAQLTTLGELSFELNVEVEENSSGIPKYVYYVANDSVTNNGEILSPYLKYPPQCGCTDPSYLQYSNAYACNIQDSCKDLIVFGCMDPQACNYDPDANFNVPELCCYPGLCADRDLAFVCPTTTYERMALYPNPAGPSLFVRLKDAGAGEATYVLYDAFGRKAGAGDLGYVNGTGEWPVSIDGLTAGVYLVDLSIDGVPVDKIRFLKRQ